MIRESSFPSRKRVKAFAATEGSFLLLHDGAGIL